MISALVALAGWAVLGAGETAAAPVLVVRSADLPAHREVERAFTSALGHPTRSVSLGSSSPEQLKQAGAESAPVVFAIGTQAALAASRLPSTRVLIHALNPSSEGLPDTLRQVQVPMFVSPSEQLRWVRKVLPNAQRLGVAFDPAVSQRTVGACQAAAKAMNFTLVTSPAATRADVVDAIRRLFGRVDALWVIPDPTVLTAETFLFMVRSSYEAKVPVIGFSDSMAKAGALLAVEPSYLQLGTKAAEAAGAALKGEELNAVRLEGRLILNVSAAGKLSVGLPDALRNEAAKVYP